MACYEKARQTWQALARHSDAKIARQARMASHGKATRYFTTRKHRASYGRAKWHFIASFGKLWPGK